MLNLKKLRRRPRQFERLVGLSVSEFEMLFCSVRENYQLQEAVRLGQRPRVRLYGAGRRFSLSLEERLLSTLLFYRLHLTGALLACLFDLDESNLWRERTLRMGPLLQELLPTPMQDHLLSALERSRDKGKVRVGNGGEVSQSRKPRKRIGTLKELLEAYPELRDICVDATEQQVPKPKDKRAKKQFYSGKSNCHTVKTQVTTAGRLVIHVLGGCAGSVADRLVCKASGVVRAVSQASSPARRKVQQGVRPAVTTSRHRRRLRLDRGYSGLEKEYQDESGVEVLAALKGTSRYRVTLLGKAWNRIMISRKRMQVEQNIGHLQNWRVLSGLYRARVKTHQNTVALVAGLHNFRLLGSLAWEK